MKCILVMFDTLCRRFLPPYGNTWVKAPNFSRLAARSVQFQNAYVGSMPCMPARREMHTGRYNFLHRSWGPLEPFDDSMPEILKQSGIYAHKVTDHEHYWEDGGATYHNRYSSYEFVRGQEGDPYIGWAGPVEHPAMVTEFPSERVKGVHHRRQDWLQRQYQTKEADQPQTITFDKGIEFIRRNRNFDDWFCQIETFDPHEPFFSQKHYQDLYPHDYDGPVFDWPVYERVTEDKQAVQHMRCMYAALVSMCDRHLGRVLDVMDELTLWDDTLLIVNTDHGFLMGEHDWWAKWRMPFFQEIAHIPLWIWDPRSKKRGERRESLVQTIDLPATILEYFGRPLPPDMQGKPLAATVESDVPVREAALYGIHGGHVNVTDGRYVYMRGPANQKNGPLNEYTLMPAHMRQMFSPKELKDWEAHSGFGFTKGVRTMRIPCAFNVWFEELDTKLFDLESDYDQEHPLQNPAIEQRMTEHLVCLMSENEAPPEQFERLGLVGANAKTSAKPLSAVAALLLALAPLGLLSLTTTGCSGAGGDSPGAGAASSAGGMGGSTTNGGSTASGGTDASVGGTTGAGGSMSSGGTTTAGGDGAGASGGSGAAAGNAGSGGSGNVECGGIAIPMGSGGPSGGAIDTWTDVTPEGVDLVSDYGAQDVLVDPARPSDVYAFFCLGGVYKSTDYGQTWAKRNTGTLGSTLEDGRPWGAAIDTNRCRDPETPPTLYTMNGYGSLKNVWKSTNGGVDWAVVTLPDDGKERADDAYDIDIDPYDGQHLIVAFHEETGIVESTDAGSTWTPVPLHAGMSAGESWYPFFIDTGDVATTRATWLAIAQQSGGEVGTWRTTDAGTTWTKVDDNEHLHGGSQIYQRDGVVYMAGVYSELGWGVLRSTDFGATWTHVGSAGGSAIVFGTEDFVYALYAPNGNTAQRAAQPGIDAWSSWSITPDQGPKRVAVTHDGANYIVVSGNWKAGLWRYVEP
jgi:arylsulfatase A-like enzyme